MQASIRRAIRKLLRNTSGNAALMLGLGLPAMIGSSGLAVDVAQWYMWKRELQYAVDQAALAGAWARTQSGSAGSYQSRAMQEFNANLATVKGYTANPTIELANYSGGSSNSVVVRASATRSLPFSSMLVGGATTVSVYAQAAFTQGATYTSCMIATDEDDSGAITISGTSVITAGCGMAALSNSLTSVVVNGSPDIQAGWVLSRGGIDDWFNGTTNNQVFEYMEGLQDPFKTLSPPNPPESQIARTYQCVKGKSTKFANVTSTATTTYTYWKGLSPSDPALVQVNYNRAKAPVITTTAPTYSIVSSEVVDGQVVTTTVNWTNTNSGNNGNTVWEKATSVRTTTYTGTNTVTEPDIGNVDPGTYTDIKVACATTFKRGVYIIDGGGLEITGQYEVNGAGVMFVLKNGAYVKIAGGANINLTAIQAADLIARGVPAADANRLAGMLIFEARDSSGSSKNNINGTSTTTLNGTIYLPQSGLDFAGTARVTSQCLMIAAATINITGTANMSSFCPSGMTEDTVVATLTTKVKLVV